MKYTFKVKAVFVGASNVGKSSLALRYVHGKFNASGESTIGAAFYPHVLEPIEDEHGDMYIMKYEIWDTAGQERYAALMPMYYRNAHVVLITFSLIARESFEDAKRWVKKLNKFDRYTNNKRPLLVLVGTKLDMAESYRQVPQKKAQQYADDEAMLYVETSALENLNVKLLFDKITRKIMHTRLDDLNELAYSTVNLQAQHEDEVKRKGGVFSRLCSCGRRD